MSEFDARRWGDLLNKLRRRLRGDAASEDYLHSAYLRFERHRQTAVVHNPEAFMLRAAANIAVDHHRRGRWIKPEPWEEACARILDASQPPDEALEVRERLKRVREALDRMPPRTRDILLMHRLDGLKYREIAVALDISQSAVEKHIAKATLFLLDCVED